MKAVVTVGHGDRSNLVYQTDYPDPQPAPDEVVIKVAATALNYHDIFTRRGMPGIKVPFPIILGADVAGEVARLGSEVTGWKAGERVLVNPLYMSGLRFGLVGESFNGGRAEYVSIAASNLIRIPPNVSLEQAASLPLAYGTAHRMLVTRGQVKQGERVLVLGASGGVGVACVQIAKLLGAEVIACASSEAKLARLSEIGADHVVDYRARNFADAVHDIVGKPRLWGRGGVDVAVNFTGGDTFVDTQKCVKLGGRILVCGATAGFDLTTDARYLWTFEQTVIGSNGWDNNDLTTLLQLIESGRLAPVIDKVLPLQDAAEAERLLEDREVIGKILLKP